MAILTPDQWERFHRDGYLKFGRVLTPEQVEALRAGLDRVIAEEQTRDTNEGRPPEFAYGHDRMGGQAGNRAIHQFINMWKVDAAYGETIHNPLITGILGELMVRELMETAAVRIWHDQVISKPPGNNKHFHTHHDFYFWPLDRPRMITCWLALDRATVENGCMHVIPGSHRDPRFQPAGCELLEELHLSPAPQGPGEPGSLYVRVRKWPLERFTPVELEAGECMFHHCLNYHCTPENTTDRQRRALVMIYMPDGTRYQHAQSPNHPCTSYLHLTDGALMDGEAFPICGAVRG